MPPQTQVPADAQVLFAEARRRRRQKRLTGCAVSLALATAATGLAVTLSHRTPAPGGNARGAAGGAPSTAQSPLVAWVDYNGRLHLGDLASRRQRVVAQVSAYPATPLVQAGGRVYWVDVGGQYEIVQNLDIATGKIQSLGFGQSVFPSADGKQVYIAEANDVTEVSAAGPARGRELAPPSGWYLPGGDGSGHAPIAVADGILVQSSDVQAASSPPTLADWNVRTGQVTVIGRVPSADYGIIGAYTPPEGGYSLVAWIPAGCHSWCSIRITNTSTRSGVTVRSPLRHGFALGGAFSPDGRHLAAFVNTSPGAGSSAVRLAIVNTATGSLRLVPRTQLVIGEDVAWAQWLGDGRQLIIGNVENNYIVTIATLSARPFFFLHGPGHGVEDGQHVNFSAVIVTPAGMDARAPAIGTPATGPASNRPAR